MEAHGQVRALIRGTVLASIASLIALLTFASAGASAAPGEFGGANNDTLGSQFPNAVAHGDFDFDGNQDVVSASQAQNGFSGRVAVRYGDGSGALGTETLVGPSGGWQDVAVTDFNGDGLDDIAAERDATSVLILLANPLGGFSESQPSVGASNSDGVAVGDFDNDGNEDLAVGGAGTFRVLYGDGTGAFTLQSFTNANGGAGEVAAGDLDGDGFDDLVMNGGYDGTDFALNVYLSNGVTGAGRGFDPVLRDTRFDRTIYYDLGDINGDGRLDLAAASQGNTLTYVALGDGDGTFTLSQQLARGRPEFADLDRDGFEDLAIAQGAFGSGNLLVHLTGGSPTLGPATTYDTGATEQEATAVDLNEDGFEDLAVVSTVERLSVFLNEGANADLALTKTDSADPAVEGQQLTYTLTATNNGPDDATDVVITDTLPTSVTFVSASSGCTNSSGTVTCDLGSIPAGDDSATTADERVKSVEITVTTDQAQTISNSASVNAAEGDPVPGNDADTEETIVQEDTDSDGVGDPADNCPSTANAAQTDTDGDGQGDACDTFPNDPDNDADGDGVSGDTDNCPSVANANQTDTDGDGQGDACDPDDDGDGTPDGQDAFPLDPDENTDTDSDTVGDNADNCPTNANASQADTDSDGQGDACEPTVGGGNGGGDDTPPAVDTADPELELDEKQSQKLAEKVKLSVGCDEACIVKATGALFAQGKPGDSARAKRATQRLAKLKRDKATLAAGEEAELVLSLSKRALRKANGADRAGQKLVAKLELVAIDAAGNRAAEKVLVTLR